MSLITAGLGSPLLITGGLAPGGAVAPLPRDLAEAIAARFAALAGTTLAGLTAIHATSAPGTPALPYLTYSIDSGTPEFVPGEDGGQWDDHRVKFVVVAATQDRANTLRDAVASPAAYGGRSLAFSSGVATPFFRVDRMEARERQRVAGSKATHRAVAMFQTRVRSDF